MSTKAYISGTPDIVIPFCSMRSSLFGANSRGGLQARGGGASDEQTEEQLERENEDELELLRDKVHCWSGWIYPLA